MKYLIFLIPFFFAGCATDSLYTTAGAGGAAALGGLLSKGDPIITGASDAGGALATTLMVDQVSHAKDNARTEGYQKGRSDAVKQQYWIIQNQQKEIPKENSRVSYIPVTTGGVDANGIKTVPTTQYIRIEE